MKVVSVVAWLCALAAARQGFAGSHWWLIAVPALTLVSLRTWPRPQPTANVGDG